MLVNQDRTIVLYNNNRRSKNDQPILRGKIYLNGQMYYADLWGKVKANEDGSILSYWSGNISLAKEQENSTQELPLHEDQSVKSKKSAKN